MAPLFSRKNVLFLFLGVFALLFGVVQSASAATCSSYGGNPNWRGAGNPAIDDCTITYSDPTGGSNLSVCKYRVLSDTNSNGVFESTEETLGWTDATHSDPAITCSGNSAVLQADVSIGSGLNCPHNGENKCRVEFKAGDNAGNSATGTIVTLDINYNTAPTISDIADQTINEDANTGALAFTIGDAETAAASLTLTKASSNTTLVPTANIVFGGSGASRTVTVTPAANLSGSATITVTVSDGSLTANDTFVLTVTAVNDAPTLDAITDPAAINEDSGLQTVNLSGISAGGGESQALTVTATSATTNIIPNPTVTYTSPNTTGSLSYTPVANASGSSVITVTVRDTGLDGTAGNADDGTFTRTFTVNVTAVNDAPTANNGTLTTNEDTAGTGTLAASDVDGNPLTYSIVANGSKGTAAITNASAGAYTYDPNDNQNGTDSFTFKVNDGSVDSNTATVSVTITAVNDAPVADPKTPTTNEDAAVTITLTGSDVDGDTLTFAIVSNPANGGLSGTGATRVYTPIANFNGTDSFTYKANDGTTDSSDATVTITVTAVNDAPTASNGTLTTNEDTAGTGTLAASDVDGNPLVFSIVANGAKGTASITNASTGAYTYTPSLNQNGSDSFTFKVNDGTADSTTATVSVTITAVNDAPVAVDESYSMYEGATLTRAAAGVLANDTDIEGSILTATTVSIPTNGSLILNSNGSLVYTPIANFNGTDSFTYKANDGAVDSNTATVTITVSDGTAPTITSFTINGTSCSGSNCNNQVVVNSIFTIAWEVSESGGSYLNNAKIYKATFVNGSCDNNDKSGCSWGQVGSTVSAPATVNSWSGSATDNPVGNTYWYGIHIADNAENCIDEDAEDADNGHCGGVTSDGLDTTRTDRGPIKVKMQHNSDPFIQGNPNDSPDPIRASTQITFTAQWNDADGDSVSFFVCKDNQTPTGGDCPGGSANRWCRNLTAVAPGTDATCHYTTVVGDAGTKNYYAFVCDDENACSSSTSGTFLVDTQAPVITTFTISPDSSVSPNWANNASPSITVTWNVSDQGSSHLDRVRAYRAPFDNIPNEDGNRCDDANKLDCAWTQAGSDAIALNNSDNWNCGATCNDRIIGSPGSGTWWYGMHVLDEAQNETSEPVPPGPKKALVDTANPSTAITSPTAGTWFKNDFNATLDDSDTGGSGLVTGASGCQYRFIGDNPSGLDISSGDLTRQCDPVTKTITVGSSPDVCRYEGAGRCRVETRSFDVAGNTSANPGCSSGADPGWCSRLYGVDFTAPQVGTPSPTTAQAGVSKTYSASLADAFTPPTTGGGQISGCSFYWKVLGGIWSDPIVTTVNPIPCKDGAECTVSADHTFASPGQYNTMFGCTDSAQPIGNTGYGANTVTVESLSVDLSAVPSPGGSVNTLFDLAADTTGSTMPGDTTYGFDCRIDTGDCTTDGNFADCDFSITTSETAYTKDNLCQYPVTAGTYTAKVAVQRGIGTADDTVSVGPISTNNIPTTTNRLVDAPNPTDYCGVTGSPPVRVRWTFSDADPGDTQGAYELEVFRVSDGVKVVDTGKKTGATQEYVFQAAGEQLSWDKTYTWQVRVWDSPNDDVSTFSSGPQFTTPAHYYPDGSFTKTPEFPGAQESVQFTDQTNFDEGGVNNSQPSINQSWSWNFGDSGSSILQNPTHTYTQTGSFGVTLQSGDDVGSCPSSQTVNVSVPFPEWQEISPF